MAHFPPLLKKGGTVGIVATSRAIDPAWIAATQQMLEDCGYGVVVHPHCALVDGTLAGNDLQRAQAVMDMFTNPDIDAILCARGGCGANRMVDYLDFKLIKKSPKPFIGFSDVTVLLNAITQKTGMVTYHGPMAKSLAYPDARSVADFFTVISSTPRSKKLHYAEAECTRTGIVEGKLVGGNLSSLQSLIGTNHEWSAKGSILFIEDVDEPLYRIDRMLQHLRLAGKLEAIKALVVGECVGLKGYEDNPATQADNLYGLNLQQIVHELVPEDVPVCFNFPCGHGKNLTTLPVGAIVKMNFSKRGVSLTFRAD